MPSVCCAVGNTVNTRISRRCDSRADDCLVYSPYNGDVHSPGKRPFVPYAGGDVRVAAAILTAVARLVPRCGVVCVNITSARNPKLS